MASAMYSQIIFVTCERRGHRGAELVVCERFEHVHCRIKHAPAQRQFGPTCVKIADCRDDWSRAYFLKNSERHSLGDAPKCVRNDLLKCDRSLNPQLKAISEMPQLFC